MEQTVKSKKKKQLPKGKSNSKQQPQVQQLLVDIITAKQDVNGLYIIPVDDGSRLAMPLNWYIGIIANCRGTWQSLGMAYNPAPGINCMEIVIYYVVPQDSGFQQQISDLVNRIKRQQKDENEKSKDRTKN